MPFEPTDYLPYDFANRRHIGPSPEEMAEMLKVVGADSLDALIDEPEPVDPIEHVFTVNGLDEAVHILRIKVVNDRGKPGPECLLLAQFFLHRVVGVLRQRQRRCCHCCCAYQPAKPH